VFAALAVTVFSFATLQSLLVPVLPVIQRDLHTDAAGATWTITSWLITAAVATPLLGRVGDLRGKRRIFLLCLAAVALGSVVAATAPTIGVLIIGRVMQGLGGAMFPLAFGMLRDNLPGRSLTGAIGATSAIMAVGSGLGTVASGPLSGALGWRGLFIIPIVGMIVGAVLTVRWVPESATRDAGRVNLPAAALLSAWLVALLLPLSTGSQWGWDSPIVIGLFVLAAVLITAWIIVELRSRVPLIDLRLMARPAIWSSHLAALFFGAGMFGVFAYFPRFVQTPVSTGYGLGETVAASGLLMLPMLVTMAVMGFITGPLGRIMGSRTQVVVAALLLAVSTASIALFHTEVWMLAIEAGVFGVGLGIGYAAITSVVVQSVPPTQTGVATGVNANLRTIGSAIGTALLTAIVTGSAGADGVPTEGGYETGFLTLAALAAVSAVVVVLARLVDRSSRVPAVAAPVTEPVAVVA
jgi:MFS family permease